MPITSRFIRGLLIGGATVTCYLLAIFWVGPRYFARHEIAPEIPFKAEIPPGLRPINAFQGEGGVIGEYLVEETPQMVSIVVAPSSGGAPPSVDEFLSEVDTYRQKRSLGERSSPLLTKYAAARFDLRRALKRSEGELNLGGSRVATVRFTEKGESWYEIGIATRGAEQVLLLAMRKEEPVDSKALERALASLPLDPPATTRSPESLAPHA